MLWRVEQKDGKAAKGDQEAQNRKGVIVIVNDDTRGHNKAQMQRW